MARSVIEYHCFRWRLCRYGYSCSEVGGLADLDNLPLCHSYDSLSMGGLLDSQRAVSSLRTLTRCAQDLVEASAAPLQRAKGRKVL